MTPETREKAIKLISNKKHTVDSINEIVTILMLEKATILTEEMVIKQLEGAVEHAVPMTELEIIQRSLDEARQA